MTHSENRPPQLDPTNPVLQQLRQFLKDLGYVTAVDSDLQDARPGSALRTMLRLFFSREPVGRATLEDALQLDTLQKRARRKHTVQPLTIDQLLATGFCRIIGEHVHANVTLQPHNDLLFAIGQLSLDPPRPEDRLMKISRSSLEVAHLMVPRTSRNALDVGTGCGFLAALLSQTSQHVYAVDLNTTAVRFAEFNTRWNNLSNVTVLQGSLFEPVRHLRFDHIVSNPPFIICPVPDSSVSHLLFQHSGQQGDTFCLQLARDAAALLEEGGLFQMMFSWLEQPDQDWREKLTASFSGLDCDVWVMRTFVQSAEEFITSWCRDLGKSGKFEKSDLDSLRREGRLYFEKNNFSSVGTGLLTLRRCADRPNLLWFDEAPEDRTEPYGSHVAAIMDVRRRFNSVPDAAFLQQKFRATPDLVTIEKAALRKGRWKNVLFELNRESGLKYSCDVFDPTLCRILTRLNDRSSLNQILKRLAREERLPLARLISAHLPTLRELLSYGFILPA